MAHIYIYKYSIYYTLAMCKCASLSPRTLKNSTSVWCNQNWFRFTLSDYPTIERLLLLIIVSPPPPPPVLHTYTDGAGNELGNLPWKHLCVCVCYNWPCRVDAVLAFFLLFYCSLLLPLFDRAPFHQGTLLILCGFVFRWSPIIIGRVEQIIVQDCCI